MAFFMGPLAKSEAILSPCLIWVLRLLLTACTLPEAGKTDNARKVKFG